MLTWEELRSRPAAPSTDSYETILNYANTTRTSTGLRVNAYLVNTNYPTGVKGSFQEMKELQLRPHDTQPPATTP